MAISPETVVLEFCRAVAGRDVDALVGFFAEDAVYHNIPLAPVRGREAIASTLRQFIEPASEAEVVQSWPAHVANPPPPGAPGTDPSVRHGRGIA